jgi:hypothetical protein
MLSTSPDALKKVLGCETVLSADLILPQSKQVFSALNLLEVKLTLSANQQCQLHLPSLASLVINCTSSNLHLSFSKLIAESKSLKSLSLLNCNFDRASMIGFAQAVSMNQSLLSLTMVKC